MRNSSIYIWILAFAVLFLLSLDYWIWDEPVVLGLWGFPTWIYYFVVIQVVLTILIYLFAKYFWKSGDEQSIDPQ